MHKIACTFRCRPTVSGSGPIYIVLQSQPFVNICLDSIEEYIPEFTGLKQKSKSPVDPNEITSAVTSGSMYVETPEAYICHLF